MVGDWERLGAAIRAARQAQGLTIKGLAEAADVAANTVKNLEGGATRRRMPISLAPVATALGWAPGSVQAVLAGGDPTPVPAAEATRRGGLAEGMPVRAGDALRSGEVIDARVIEFGTDGSGLRMVAVLMREADLPADPEETRRTLARWDRAQRDLEHGAGDPGGDATNR